MTTSSTVRVLVVDDEPEVREVLREFLEAEGYEVLVAETATGAVSAVREHKPTIVLLDLNMPGAVHGGAIIQLLSREVPVVVITAVIDEGVAREAIRNGASDLIMKPFDLHRVRDVILAVLRGRRTD